VNVQEPLLLEEIVDRLANLIAEAGDRPEGIGPRPQMRNGSQELEGVAFLLKRIFLGVRRADTLNS